MPLRKRINKPFHKDKHPRLHDFTNEFYQITEEEIIPMSYKYFQGRENKGILPN